MVTCSNLSCEINRLQSATLVAWFFPPMVIGECALLVSFISTLSANAISANTVLYYFLQEIYANFLLLPLVTSDHGTNCRFWAMLFQYICVKANRQCWALLDIQNPPPSSRIWLTFLCTHYSQVIISSRVRQTCPPTWKSSGFLNETRVPFQRIPAVE